MSWLTSSRCVLVVAIKDADFGRVSFGLNLLILAITVLNVLTVREVKKPRNTGFIGFCFNTNSIA